MLDVIEFVMNVLAELGWFTFRGVLLESDLRLFAIGSLGG